MRVFALLFVSTLALYARASVLPLQLPSLQHYELIPFEELAPAEMVAIVNSLCDEAEATFPAIQRYVGELTKKKSVTAEDVRGARPILLDIAKHLDVWQTFVLLVTVRFGELPPNEQQAVTERVTRFTDKLYEEVAVLLPLLDSLLNATEPPKKQAPPKNPGWKRPNDKRSVPG